MKNQRQESSRRRRTGNVLIFFTGLLLIGSATAKLVGVPPVVAQLGADGFAGWRLTAIALLEILSALLFLVPATRSFGLLMVSAYMGGALAAHFGHGQPFPQAVLVLLAAWVGAFLRHPQILWSFPQATQKTANSLTGDHANALRQI